jgi:predicted DNA-binding transcriptional regulator AlpA
MEQLDGKEYLMAREVAALKGIAEQAVWRAAKQGKLPAIKRLDRWLILPADADAWTPGTWGDVSRMQKKGGGE